MNFTKCAAVSMAAGLFLSGCGGGEGASVGSLPAAGGGGETVVARAEAALASDAQGREFVADELLVQYRDGATPSDKARARGRAGASRAEVVRGGTRELELARIPPGLAVSEAARRIAADPSVEFAEPNWVYTHQATSADPYYVDGKLWGMRGGYGIGADAAWANWHTGSDSIYVGVIDEGIFHGHADLQGVVGNPGEVNGRTGVDDDGNGKVDDVHGWDFDGNNNTVYDGTTDDHGTHVAGTIGARANATGVVGVNWNVKLISAKFLGKRGGTTANAIKAVDYFTDLKQRGVNLVATNNSWGGGGFSQALLDAITRSRDAGILFIAAAGNGGRDGVGDNNDAAPSYPASYVVQPTALHPYDNVVAVAAITSTGAKSSFSNYGRVSVDVGAPGSAIWSTIPGKNNTSTYASWNGTSMATPHVTGAAALYAASHVGATPAEVRNAILSTATPTASLTNLVSTGGRLNASGF